MKTKHNYLLTIYFLELNKVIPTQECQELYLPRELIQKSSEDNTSRFRRSAIFHSNNI